MCTYFTNITTVLSHHITNFGILQSLNKLQACLNIRKNVTKIRLMSPTIKIGHQNRILRLVMLMTDRFVANIFYEVSWYKMTWYEVHVV